MSNEIFFSIRSNLSSVQKKQGSVTWRCPSNLALVKYWGKYEEQLPCNPSISLTLSNAYTETKMDYKICDQSSLDFFFEGRSEPVFIQNISEFMDKLDNYFPFLAQLKLEIHSLNSFPHYTGISFSASVMGALALCLCSIEEDITGHKSEKDVFYRKAAFIARLGSGSATRSVYGGAVLWGKLLKIHGSSDLYGVQLESTSFLDSLNDTILIVSTEKQKIFKSIDHEIMHNHSYSTIRFEQAKQHSIQMLDIIRNQDYFAFCQLVEEEALTLHALMMSASPSYLLLFPGTINIISKVRAFREKSEIPICFTLDAGPNVHLLYPNKYKSVIKQFIKDELLSYCEDEKWLDDCVGKGPVLIERS